MKPLHRRILIALQWFLYVCFVALWFKGNILQLRKIKVGYLVPLLPLLGIIVLRCLLSLRNKKASFRPKFDKTVLTVLILLFVATAVRLPFIFNGIGMMNSDDAVAALMSKHISEGKMPPISYYGQLYMGTLLSHFSAVVFKAVGYSILALHFSTLLVYLAFIAVQFLLLKEIFSLPAATILSLFYCLPIGQLVRVSIETSSSYSLVLLLGSALIYTAYAIAYKKKPSWIPLLGFLMGLSFWTHQITTPFILTSLILITVKARPPLKKFGTLTIYGLLGGLPLVLQEIFNKFQIFYFLAGGEKGSIGWEKVKASIPIFKSLALLESPPLVPVLFVLLLSGMGALAYVAVKSKGKSPQSIFLLFAVLFCVLYFPSRFSDRQVIRYLYPFYFCLPVLLLAPFLLIRSRLKHVVSLVIVTGLLIADGLPVHYAYYPIIKKNHRFFLRMISAMEQTGNRYWLGDYWNAYLLTAASKEKILVDSITFERYLPYRLIHYNRENADNYVFIGGPNTSDAACAWSLNQLLTSFGIRFQRQTIGEGSLFSNIESPVFPSVLYEDVPTHIPRLEIEAIQNRGGYLRLAFKNMETRESSKFWLTVEIPGYSASTAVLPGASEKIVMTIPFPPGKAFPIRYFLEYKALKVPSSIREFSYSPPHDGQQKRADQIVFLRGIGPRVSRSNRDVHYCKKEAAFEIAPPQGPTARLRLVINSPFYFSDLKWYGDYAQEVSIRLNGGPAVDRQLRDGTNVLDVDLSGVRRDQRPILVTINFRYHFLFDFANLQKIAAFLESVEISE